MDTRNPRGMATALPAFSVALVQIEYGNTPKEKLGTKFAELRGRIKQKLLVPKGSDLQLNSISQVSYQVRLRQYHSARSYRRLTHDACC
ncbi:hypothetical protein EVAR_68318_1 [Eumeta japonica]|uniref:Uncharacterized protein n=1 Tax=Eumeta variegata TaxID=151549 RepID=A0A4C2AG25_EUMVA|nr:hypothetical protein EVAR_68318_1 [Eumeta japonica]